MERIKDVDDKQLFIIRQSSLKLAKRMMWYRLFISRKRLYNLAERITNYVICGLEAEES